MDIKSRLQNKTFLVAIFSGALLLTQQLGLHIFPSNVADIFNTILSILVLLGIVIDPTTKGISDK